MANTTIAAAPARLSKSRLPVTAVEITQELKEATAPHPARIDVIPLFGSHTLIRASDAKTWLFVTPTAKPVRLSKRQSMFINAALTAARGQ